MKTTELLTAVLNADEDTREAIKYILNLTEKTTDNKPYSLQFIKTELPRQSGKSSLALGNVLKRAANGERVCLYVRDGVTAWETVKTLRSITGNSGIQAGRLSSIGRGQLEVCFPSYYNLLGKYFDTIVFDESWEVFMEKAKETTSATDSLAMLISIVKNNGTIIRLETKNEGDSRNR